jgi:adenylate kinase
VKLSTSLSNKFNFHHINLNALFGGEGYHSRANQEVCERVIAELHKVDKIYRGVVISGFPNNAVQADTLQKAGIIPERYFIMYNDEPAVRQSYLKRHSEEEVELLMDRNTLELKELKGLLGDQADQLPLVQERALEKMNATVSIRLKKVTPLEAPRVLIMYPPYMVPKTLANFA